MKSPYGTAFTYYDSHAEVDSSALEEVWHDSLTSTLYVKFNNGTIAGYAGVPVNTYNKLVDAQSVGRFYTYSIKNYYTGVNGDVNLVRRPEAKTVPVPGSTRYEVLIAITGDLKLQVLASDFGDASEQVVKLLNEITTAAYTVKSVTTA